LLENAGELFSKDRSQPSVANETIKKLHAKIGQLTVENDF